MSDKDRDADLNTAMALTQRLLGSSGGTTTAAKNTGAATRLWQNLRYWLWRAGGRKRAQLKDGSHVSRLLDNYQIEGERLRQTHGRDLAAQKQAHERIVTEIQSTHQQSIGSIRAAIMAEAEATNEQLRKDLARERQRIGQLEQLAAEFQRVYQGALAKAHSAGTAAAQPDVDAAHDRLTALEDELTAQQIRHAEELHERLDEAARHAETGMAVLRAELNSLRESAQLTQEQIRQQCRNEADNEIAALRQRLDDAERDKATAQEQAARTHEASLAALRTRHAEELAETRTAGEWSLSDAKRQIADLRLRLNEQDEANAAELDALHARHKAELALWLEKFERAQAQQEIRHAGEYAGTSQMQAQALTDAQARIVELGYDLEQTRQALAISDDRREGVEAERARLAEHLAEERQTRTRRQEEWQNAMADAHAAAQTALERSDRMAAELATERQTAQENAERLAALRTEILQLRGEIPPPPPADLAAATANHQAELCRQQEEHALALARLRLDSSRRIADLERLLSQAQALAQEQAQPAPAQIIPLPPVKSGIDWEARTHAALDRARLAEADAQRATNKIEVLKDALAAAKARPMGTTPTLVVDNRFRDLKRAFARAFHPDQGGRHAPDKAALFLEFWPTLEKIEKDEN